MNHKVKEQKRATKVKITNQENGKIPEKPKNLGMYISEYKEQFTWRGKKIAKDSSEKYARLSNPYNKKKSNKREKEKKTKFKKVEFILPKERSIHPLEKKKAPYISVIRMKKTLFGLKNQRIRDERANQEQLHEIKPIDSENDVKTIIKQSTTPLFHFEKKASVLSHEKQNKPRNFVSYGWANENILIQELNQKTFNITAPDKGIYPRLLKYKEREKPHDHFQEYLKKKVDSFEGKVIPFSYAQVYGNGFPLEFLNNKREKTFTKMVPKRSIYSTKPVKTVIPRVSHYKINEKIKK